jgi:hypothetical protein
MAGYKRKSTTSRRAPVKRAAKRTVRRAAPYRASSNALGDSTTVLVSAYFEVDAQQPAPLADAAQNQARGGVVGYSIKCDPMAAKCTIAGAVPTGGALALYGRDADNAQFQSGTAIAFPRLTQLKELYRQYRVNSVSCKVTTDRHCGLDNPLIALSDKGAAQAVTAVGKAMSQAHRSKVLTEADRTMQYGWKPKTTSERDFHMIADGIADDNAQFVKILQELEPNAESYVATCKHRVELVMSVTLKDSRMGN